MFDLWEDGLGAQFYTILFFCKSG